MSARNYCWVYFLYQWSLVGQGLVRFTDENRNYSCGLGSLPRVSINSELEFIRDQD